MDDLSPQPPRVDAREAATLAQVSSTDLRAVVKSVTSRGSLCPPGEQTEVEYQDALFTARTSAELLAGAQATSGDCTYTIEVEVPARYQFSTPFMQWTTYYVGSPPAAAASARATYSFAGGPSESFSFTLVNDEETRSKHAFRQWSPCTGGARPSRVRLLATLNATVRGSEEDPSYLRVPTLDGSFGMSDGTAWRRCGATTEVQEPPSTAGGPCGGPSARTCMVGLTCEVPAGIFLSNGALTPGTCVRPSVLRPAPARRDLPCGGVNRIGCAAGLVCHYPNRSVMLPHTTGVCSPVQGVQVDDPCGGEPAIACGPNLACGSVGRSPLCKPAGGQLNDVCGPSMTPCKAGLQCREGGRTWDIAAAIGTCR